MAAGHRYWPEFPRRSLAVGLFARFSTAALPRGVRSAPLGRTKRARQREPIEDLVRVRNVPDPMTSRAKTTHATEEHETHAAQQHHHLRKCAHQWCAR